MQQDWLPYCGAAPVPDGWMAQWNLDPLLLVALGALTAWMIVRASSTVQRYRAVLGGSILALLFVSPLCALTSALFSVRVTHHLLLTSIVAPLLLSVVPRTKLPGGAILWAALHMLTFWMWHSPQVYGWALSNDGAYWAMQLSLLLSAMAMWASIERAPAPLGIAALLLTMVQMGLLGALISFAGRPLYAPHLLTTQAWGLDPLEDQQLAGLIMWAPGSALYLAAAMLIGWRWFQPARPVAA
ncbi:MAG: cytochrome c oxidase assembly protein [Pseudomonadota bacterium]